MEAIGRRVDSLPTLSGQVGRVVGFFAQNSLPFVGVEAIHQTHAAVYEERIVIGMTGIIPPRVIIDLNLARVVGSRHSASLIRKSVGGTDGPTLRQSPPLCHAGLLCVFAREVVVMGMRIRVAVVARSPLLHDGLVRVLREDPALLISSEMVQCDTLITSWRSPSVDVVVIHVPAPLQPSVWRDIALLTLQSKVLALLRSRDPDLVKRAVQLGISGIVTEDADRDVLFNAIREVASGRVWNASPPAALPAHNGIAAPSNRECEVLGLVRRGLSNREIGDRLCISERTVKSHVNRLLQKCQVKNRVQLALCSTDAIQEVTRG